MVECETRYYCFPDSVWSYWCVNTLFVCHVMFLGFLVLGGHAVRGWSTDMWVVNRMAGANMWLVG